MFRDRVDAGRHLAEFVQGAGIGRRGDAVVLGLPRGGVPVAGEVARLLGAPLDVIVVRKLGVPFQPELAMGALGEDGVRVVNDDVVESTGLTPADVDKVERVERAELDRRVERYRRHRARVDLQDRCAVIVDDGIATGSTAHAACRVARAHGSSRIVLAVPVAPQRGPGPCRRRATRCSAWHLRIRSTRWGCGTATSLRRRTTRSSGCCASFNRR